MEFETAKKKAETIVDMYQKMLDINLIDNALTAKDYAIKNIELAQELAKDLGDDKTADNWESVKLEVSLL